MSFKKLSLLLIATILSASARVSIAESVNDESEGRSRCEAKVLAAFDDAWLSKFPLKLQEIAARLQSRGAARETNPYYLAMKNLKPIEVLGRATMPFEIRGDLYVFGSLSFFDDKVMVYIFSVQAKYEEASRIAGRNIYHQPGEMPRASLRQARELIDLFEALFLIVDDHLPNWPQTKRITLKTAEIRNPERLRPLLNQLGMQEIPEPKKETSHFRADIDRASPDSADK